MAVRIEESLKNVATMTKKTGGVSNRLIFWQKRLRTPSAVPSYVFSFVGSCKSLSINVEETCTKIQPPHFWNAPHFCLASRLQRSAYWGNWISTASEWSICFLKNNNLFSHQLQLEIFKKDFRTSFKSTDFMKLDPRNLKTKDWTISGEQRRTTVELFNLLNWAYFRLLTQNLECVTNYSGLNLSMMNFS